MSITEFQENIVTIQDKLGPIQIKLNERFGAPNTFGYYLDESTNNYFIYEVTERQRFIIWNRVNTEEEALEDLLDTIKFNSGIRD